MKRLLPLVLATTLLACGDVSDPEVIAWFEVHVDDYHGARLILAGEATVDDGALVELEVRLFHSDSTETPVQIWTQPLADLGTDVQPISAVYTKALTRCGSYSAVVIVRDDAGGEGTSEPYDFDVSCNTFASQCAPDDRYAYVRSTDAATAVKGSCTESELDAFGAEAERGAASYSSLRASVAGTCAACVFTDLSTSALSVPAWAAFGVVTEGEERGFGLFNEGWCVANRVQSPRCGALVHAKARCEARVCDRCRSDEAQYEACLPTARRVCEYVQRATQSECPEGYEYAARTCAEMSPVAQIRELCGP